MSTINSVRESKSRKAMVFIWTKISYITLKNTFQVFRFVVWRILLSVYKIDNFMVSYCSQMPVLTKKKYRFVLDSIFHVFIIWTAKARHCGYFSINITAFCDLDFLIPFVVLNSYCFLLRPKAHSIIENYWKCCKFFSLF